jgi:hypothetical protein
MVDDQLAQRTARRLTRPIGTRDQGHACAVLGIAPQRVVERELTTP